MKSSHQLSILDIQGYHHQQQGTPSPEISKLSVQFLIPNILLVLTYVIIYKTILKLDTPFKSPGFVIVSDTLCILLT